METPGLAFIGLGNMGAGMAIRLLERGFPVTVHNRTPDKAEPVCAAGAQLAPSAVAAAAGADVVLVSLSDDAAVEQVVFGELGPALRPGTVVIDTSTVSPDYARAASRRLAEGGLRRVEACVIGNPRQARQGHLRILAAGTPDDVEGVRDILAALGHQVLYVGEPGQAATMKLVFNLLLGAQVSALAEAVSYGVDRGLDRDMLLSTIASSGFSSTVMSFRAEVMRGRRYQPAGFRAGLMEKDLRLALADASGAGTAMPVLDRVHDRFAAVVGAGDGDKDAAIVIEHARSFL